ncbi:MAG: hypothetical protein V4617_10650 [Gemmatimonadota bacterium]
MITLFLTCAVAGGVLLLAGLVFGALGAGHDLASHDAPHDMTSDGLQLFSVRALSAAVAFFGIGGLGAATLGLPSSLVFIAALLLGTMAMFGVAVTMRAMMGLQRDASLDIRTAVGQQATVYVPVPASREGTGKVVLALGGRTVEYQAVTADGINLPTGAPVVVVAILGSDTVEVVSLPTVDGVR